MKVLVLCGDQWHPKETVQQGLLGTLSNKATNKNLLQKEIFFDFIDNLADTTINSIYNYDALILAKANHSSEVNTSAWVTPNIEKNIRNYVGRGSMLVVIHSGLVGYSKHADLNNLIGGSFTHHPDPCIVKVSPLTSDLIGKSIECFEVFDEHYFVTTDTEVEVFLETTSQHGSQPGGWINIEGRGKVIALTPGHFNEVWSNESMQTLLIDILNMNS